MTATILPSNVARASFKKIMNGIGSGTIEIPLSDPDVDAIIDPLMRQGHLIRIYTDDRFRYAFYGEELSHDMNEEGNTVARITGRGMEVVALWSKLLPHDAPQSPSLSPTWVYGSTENFISNPGFDDVADDPILKNPNGEEGNDDDGAANGWSKRGKNVTSITAIKDSLEARTDDWYIETVVTDNHSGMEQSITVVPNKVYHVQAYVKDETMAGMRVTLALGGAEDISATATYTENFEYGDEILAELDNVARNVLGNGLPGGSTDGTWQVLDVEVLTGEEQTSLTIAIQNDHHSTGVFVPFWVDDVTIEGWGLGLDPWVVFSPDNHDTDSFRLATTPTHGSTAYSCEINPTGQFAGLYQTMDVNPLTKYTATIWVRTASPAVDDYYRLQIVANDGNDTFISGTIDIVPDDDTWTRFQTIFTTDTDTDSLKFRFFYSGVNDAAVAYVDSASLVPGEPASTAGKIANEVLDKMAIVGKLTYLTRTWTDTLDSGGVSWPSALSLDIEPSESLYGLLSRFVALGHEWEIVPVDFIEGGENGFALNLYKARAFDIKTGVGTNYTNVTDGPVIMHGDAVVAGRVIKKAFGVNTVFGLGEDGVWSQAQQFPYETVDIPASDPAPAGYKDSYGIIEEVISVNASDTDTVSEYAGGRLSDEKGKERSLQVNMQRSAELRPLLHFQVGDSLFVDMPPHNADAPDPTTGIRTFPKRVRAIQATMSGEGADVTFAVDIDRVIYEDELGWLALVAQLAERSPAENTSQGTGKVSSTSGVVSTGGSGTSIAAAATAIHTHDLTSTDITDKATSGDISGTLPGPITVNKVKGMPFTSTIPAEVADTDLVFVYDHDLSSWVPTILSPIKQQVWTHGPVIAVTTGLYEMTFTEDVEIIEVEARVAVAPTGSTVIVDVHKDAVTLYTTQGLRPIIATATKSLTTTPDITSVLAGEALTIDVDQKDSNDVAVNLSVVIRYRRA